MSDLRSHYFNLAFSEPPTRQGLSESDPEATEGVRLFRYHLRQEVDEFLRRAESLLAAEGQGPALYFNYIKANSFNSTAKLYNNYYFIGIHDGAIRRMLPLARALAEKPELYKALGYRLSSPPSGELVSETTNTIGISPLNNPSRAPTTRCLSKTPVRICKSSCSSGLPAPLRK